MIGNMKRVIYFFLLIGVIFVLQACQTEQQYLIHFNTMRGEQLNSEYITKKTDLDQRFIPKRSNYIFCGWHMDEKLITPYDSKQLKEGLTVYAKWEEPDLLQFYLAAYQKHQNAMQFQVSVNGEIDAKSLGISVNQSLISIRKRKYEQMYQYSASSGTANTFLELYGTAQKIILKKGTPNKEMLPGKVTFEETTTLEAVKEQYGVLPTELNYFVTVDTVLRVSEEQGKASEKRLILVLDPILATQAYQKNIIAVNSLESKDVQFSKVILDVTINEEGFFSKIVYEEEYQVLVKLPLLGWKTTNIKASITEVFEYREVEIQVLE